VRRGFAAIGRSCLLAAALVLSVVSPALADRAFHPRFSTNANGDIAIVGNTLETCPSAAADCANARAGRGGALNNNGFAMERVDVDNTALDSSSARLSLPAGGHQAHPGSDAQGLRGVAETAEADRRTRCDCQRIAPVLGAHGPSFPASREAFASQRESARCPAPGLCSR
jgi:hypothetical protein